MNDDAARRAALATRVRRMLWVYVVGRTKSRTGLDPEKFEKAPDPRTGRPRRQYPEKWRDTQKNVAQDTFLQMRSRRSQKDFLEYFTGTICAHGQGLNEAAYVEVADALLSRDEAWEDVRALAMLAVSTMVHV